MTSTRPVSRVHYPQFASRPLAVFLGFTVVVAGAGYLFFEQIARSAKSNAATELASIGKLKAEQIRYYIERFDRNARSMARLVEQGGLTDWLRRGSGEPPASWRRSLRDAVQSRNDGGLLILDRSGQVRLGVGQYTHITAEGRRLALRAVAETVAVNSDIYRGDPAAPAQALLDVFVPLMDRVGKRAAGVLVLRNDLAYLDSLIQASPVENRTGETVLARKDGEDALFLNELRFRKQTALRMRVPLNTDRESPAWPATAAVRGDTGIWEALDYRPQPILAYTLPVPNTGWGMVVKVDMDEVLEPVQRLRSITIGVTTAFILLALVALLAWLRATRAEVDRHRSESAEQYRTLFNSMLEGFCIIEVLFDASGQPVDYRFLEINTAFEAQTGLRDAQGKRMREMAPNHEEHWFQMYGKIALTGEPARFVNEAKELNRWYDVCAYRIGGSDSRKVAILFNDISELKRAEQKVLSQLEHLHLLDHITRAIGERQDLKSIFQVVVRSLEDSLPIDFGCVCLYDPVASALNVISVGAKSEALAHELTMDEQSVIGIDSNGLGRCVQGRLVYEADVAAVHFPFPERLARGGLGSVVMAPLLSESRVFGVLVVARRETSAFTSVECEFLRQLSEHVALAAHQAQLYGALQQAYDDLRQTQQAVMQEERLRALGQMASGIAHDINNALSPVSLYTESRLETERNLSDRSRGYLATIQRAVEDVAQTVARMREFYRARETQLELTPVQLNTMVQQVVDLTRARWYDMPQQTGVVIQQSTELAADLPMVMGVESEIRESLTNLVFNALDAMPDGGTLTLRTRLAVGGPPSVVVEVSDTGFGMDEETRRRCLEPFFTTKGERGTGLGLAMVFGMVQRHSGEIEIDSTPGGGTTVRLTFAVPAMIQAESGEATRPRKAPSRLRLLLIDDDPIILKSMCDALGTDGHVIVTANGGEAGIAAFRRARSDGSAFAAVVTDLGMPHVDGRRVAAAVKAVSPTTPVIMLTGWGQRLVADGDTPPHVDRVLAKPPKLRELRDALAELCQDEAKGADAR